MSMNVNWIATRKIRVVKTGRLTEQTISFDALQTPTKVSYEIQKSADPQQAYIDWALSYSKPTPMPIYADDDLFGEGQPIDHELYCPYLEHVARFREWIAECEQNGYTVKVEVW